MSKFETVRKALESNPAVVVVDLKTENYFPNRHDYFTQTARFLVAPTVGLYTVDALQRFMHSLVPGLKPTSVDAFYQSSDSLEFGKLYFDEKIGEERVVTQVTHTMTDPEFTRKFEVTGDNRLKNIYGLNRQGVLVVDSHRTVDHQRRTWVRPFPTEQFVRDLLEGRVDGEYSTRLSVLQQYEPNVPRRATTRLLGA